MHPISESYLQKATLPLARTSWGIKYINYQEKPEITIQTCQQLQCVPK